MATVSVGWLPDPLSPSLAPLSPASIVMVEARSADNEDSKGVVDVVKDVVVRIEDVEDDKAVNSDDSEDVGRNVGFDVEAKNFELDEVVKLEMAMSDATKEEAVSFSSNVEDESVEALDRSGVAVVAGERVDEACVPTGISASDVDVSSVDDNDCTSLGASPIEMLLDNELLVSSRGDVDAIGSSVTNVVSDEGEGNSNSEETLADVVVSLLASLPEFADDNGNDDDVVVAMAEVEVFWLAEEKSGEDMTLDGEMETPFDDLAEPVPRGTCWLVVFRNGPRVEVEVATTEPVSSTISMTLITFVTVSVTALSLSLLSSCALRWI